MKKVFILTALLLCHSITLNAMVRSDAALSLDLNKADFLQKTEKKQARIHMPLITTNERGGLVVNDLMKKNQATLLKMNDLSYFICKGSKYLEENVKALEELQQQGWDIYGFGGLEGTFNTYADIMGFVAHNKKDNLINVVFHGTANDSEYGSSEGWETNFQANLINSAKLPEEYLQDSFTILKNIFSVGSFDQRLNAMKKIWDENQNSVLTQHFVSFLGLPQETSGEKFKKEKLDKAIKSYMKQHPALLHGKDSMEKIMDDFYQYLQGKNLDKKNMEDLKKLRNKYNKQKAELKSFEIGGSLERLINPCLEKIKKAEATQNGLELRHLEDILKDFQKALLHEKIRLSQFEGYRKILESQSSEDEKKIKAMCDQTKANINDLNDLIITTKDRVALVKTTKESLFRDDPSNPKTPSNLKGLFHRGFLKKYYTAQFDMKKIIRNLFDNMSADDRKETVVTFSGHSQAGGTAQNAQVDFVANEGKIIFGDDFNNTKHNRVFGYYLSAARTGDKDFVKWAHKVVGQNNMIRQNVNGDPVPVSSANENSPLNKLLSSIPGWGHQMKNLAEFDDAGTLLLDNPVDTWERAKALYIAKDPQKEALFQYFEDACLYAANVVGLTVEENEILKNIFPGSQKKVGFLGKIKNFFVKTPKVAQLGYSIIKAIKGDKEAQKEIMDLLTERFAHYHYGFNVPNREAQFDPRLVGTDMDQLLTNGQKHLEDINLKK